MVQLFIANSSILFSKLKTLLQNGGSDTVDNVVHDTTQAVRFRKVEKSKEVFARKMDRVKRISIIDEEELEIEDEFKIETDNVKFEQSVVPGNTPSTRRKINSMAENLSTPLLRSSTESLIDCIKNVSKTLSLVKTLDEDDKVRKVIKHKKSRLHIY